ncbi:MAG: gluconokinase [Bacteroidota bacterium]
MIYIVLGVSGSGKSTIGKALADRLSIDFYDADDFHPPGNVNKMSQGIPLNDKDRYPWLEAMRSNFEEWSKSGVVLACSALKEDYRKFLNENSDKLVWIFLDGSLELIAERIKKRAGHFMKVDLLQSQFDALEIPAYGIHIDIDQTPEQIIDELVKKLTLEHD